MLYFHGPLANEYVPPRWCSIVWFPNPLAFKSGGDPVKEQHALFSTHNTSIAMSGIVTTVAAGCMHKNMFFTKHCTLRTNFSHCCFPTWFWLFWEKMETNIKNQQIEKMGEYSLIWKIHGVIWRIVDQKRQHIEGNYISLCIFFSNILWKVSCDKWKADMFEKNVNEIHEWTDEFKFLQMQCKWGT